MRPVLIGGDWGTSSLRLYLLSGEGAVLERREEALGISRVPEGRFESALDELVAPWRGTHGALPVLLSGMIGSRQGWAEAPYAACPAEATALARALVLVPSRGGGAVRIVPGVENFDAAGRPDVMRGEETQIVGAMAELGLRDGLFVLPGTHSKWVRVAERRILSFRTYMTGEVYAVLRQHSILGRLMEGERGEGSGFRAGVAAAAELGGAGDLLNRLFSVRALGLFDRLPPRESADYLSGLLIGAEIAAAAREAGGPILLVGDAALSARYADAAVLLGLSSRAAPPDCAARGLFLIAADAGLLAG